MTSDNLASNPSSSSSVAQEVDLDPAFAPPLRNGEVVFEAPWQGRAFAMAVALHEAQLFTWADFQQQLITVVGEWDADATPDGQREGGQERDYPYYELFLEALTRLLTCRDIVAESLLDQRINEFKARPRDHDHDHDHHHDHHDH
jgi:nitrile hydratase accessory protein